MTLQAVFQRSLRACRHAAASRARHMVRALLAVFALAAGMPGVAQAQPGAQGQTKNTLLGEIENLMITNPTDPWSGGWARIGGQDFVLPRNFLIDLPANRLSLHDLFAQAPPACLALGQSGLARADSCLGGRPGAYASTMNANRLGSGPIVLGEIWIDKGLESLEGVISYINYDDGYFRINGTGTAGGTMVRINDPVSRHTIQKGLGCLAGSENCSADPRFTEDDNNYTITGTTGYPICIPSTQGATAAEGSIRTVGSNASGAGDPFCPATNRLTNPVPDSTRFAPIRVGDHIKVEGNFEVINGVRFLSAHTANLHVDFLTRNDPTQPDYLIFDEIGWDVPGFNNGRTRMLMIGFTTLSDSQVDIYALRVSPTDNQNYESVIASTVGNPDSTIGVAFAGKGSLFKFQYDVDFIDATRQTARRPCPVLIGAGFLGCTSDSSSLEDFAILSPVSREIIGRTRRTLNAGVVARDINGRPTQSGEYLAPIGVGHPEFAEIDLGALMTPFVFEGEPWNWDRRLSPGGCLDSGCDATPQPLDPFPSSGIDPRVVLGGGSVPPPVPNRIFTFFTPTGNMITHPNGIQTPELTPHLLAGYPASTTPAPGTPPGPSPLPPPVDGGGGGGGTGSVAVPNVVGQLQASAVSAITGAGLIADPITAINNAAPAGTVLGQSPIGGTVAATGSSVSLVVSAGVASVIVPGVTGQTQANAQAAITGAGLAVGAVTSANSATVAAGLVISQNPIAGTSVAPGSAVALVVSLGPALVTVPGVTGQTQAAAQAAITGAGLAVGAVSSANSATVAAGLVISQNPIGGTSVAPGSAVALVVSLGPALVTVPSVVGLTQPSAQTAITGAGLSVGTVTTASSDTVAAGLVISQNPAGGGSAALGSAVSFVVSTGPAAAGSPTVDATVFADGSGALTTAAFSTTAPGDVLVALVGSDGPTTGANNQNMTISGGGLTWTRVQRNAVQRGVVEIWTATAPTVLTNVTVTSTQSVTVVLGLPVNQSLAVIAFSNASGIGASGIRSGITTNANATLVTQAANSLVYGLGNDFDRAVSRTVGAGQTRIHQFLAPSGDTFWMQSLNSTTTPAGTSVTLNATAAGVADQWNMAVVEIKR
jgi:beta-lactam-binding protein with PASTA domain